MQRPTHSPQPSSTSPVPPPDMPRHTPTPERTLGAFVIFIPQHLPLTFEYPSHWIAGEEEGRDAAYQQVIVLGPRNLLDTYSAGLTIRLLPSKERGGTYASLEELTQWRRTQEARSEISEVLRDQPRELLGLRGIELEFRTSLDLAPKERGGPMIPTAIRTRMVLLAQADRFIELVYTADALDYARYVPVFERLLESIRWQETSS